MLVYRLQESLRIVGASLAGQKRRKIGRGSQLPGARTLVTLINALKQRGAKIGIDSLCIGGGEAVAMAVELC